MKRMTRFFIFLVKAFLVFALLIFIFNGILMKPLLSSSLGLYWDADISIRSVRIDWLLPGVVFEDVQVGSPYGFPRGNSFEIEKVVMRFGKEKPFLNEGALKPVLLDIKIRKIELMRRVSGHLNLKTLVDSAKSHSKRGLGVAPYETRIFVQEVIETDATSPLLKRESYTLSNQEFIFGEVYGFRFLAQGFSQELFKRIGLNEEGKVPALAAPQYHGITAAVEQEIREQAEKDAKQQADAAEFAALSTTTLEPSSKAL